MLFLLFMAISFQVVRDLCLLAVWERCGACTLLFDAALFLRRLSLSVYLAHSLPLTRSVICLLLYRLTLVAVHLSPSIPDNIFLTLDSIILRLPAPISPNTQWNTSNGNKYTNFHVSLVHFCDFSARVNMQYSSLCRSRNCFIFQIISTELWMVPPHYFTPLFHINTIVTIDWFCVAYYYIALAENNT